MTTEWVITAAAELVELGKLNRGEITFTVTNPGSSRDRVVFEVVAGDGGSGSWFTVEEPQRMVDAGASVSYLVRIAAPAGAPAGSYWLQGRAYSADTAPEEGSRLSGRVAFGVRETAEPKTPWWPYAVAAAVLVVVLGVVGFLVFGGDNPPANDCIEGFIWREAVPNDRVCVIQQRRDQAQVDNSLADSRRSPTGGAYGPDTCLQGFVWRNATPTDHVCVTVQTRTETQQDNALAASRRRTG